MKFLMSLMPVLVLVMAGAARADGGDKRSVDIPKVCESCTAQANETAIVDVPVGGGDVKSGEEGGDKSATSALGAKSQKK